MKLNRENDAWSERDAQGRRSNSHRSLKEEKTRGAVKTTDR